MRRVEWWLENVEFEQAYSEFILRGIKEGTPSTAERLKEGQQHAEREFAKHVWWPAFGNFDYLHPEFEVHDFREGKRFIDFAYIRRNYRIAIEIDGYGPHFREVSQKEFEDERSRQNQLTTDGWRILRFAYSMVRDTPRRCEQETQQMLGKLSANLTEPFKGLSAIHQGIMWMAYRLDGSVRSRDVIEQFAVHRQTAESQLKSLEKLGYLVRASTGTSRVTSFRIHPRYANLQF